MGRARGDETAQSGPTVNANLKEIDRSRRNLNTASWGLRSNVASYILSTYKVALKGMVWNEGFEVLVHEKAWWWLLEERQKMRPGVGAGMLRLETENKLSISRCSGFDLIGQDNNHVLLHQF